MIKIYCLKGKYSGIALWPFMLLKKGASDTTVNHELIHFAQQKELLIFPFYLIYVINYIVNLIRYGNHNMAYRMIVFEREAYENQHDKYYLKFRKHFAYLKYMR